MALKSKRFDEGARCVSQRCGRDAGQCLFGDSCIAACGWWQSWRRYLMGGWFFSVGAARRAVRFFFLPLVALWCGFSVAALAEVHSIEFLLKTMALWLCVAVFLSLVPRGALSTALECPDDYEWLGKKGVVMKWIKSEALGKCYAISRKWWTRLRRR